MAPTDAGAQRESRFANLLQPNRDLATNWSVDVGKQLESYLAELGATGLFDDGSLNFAEAALLIQGSIQVYSRKVEYLYALVLQALEFLAQKKQAQEGGKSPSQENEADDNAAEEKDEEFLNLDDVPEENNIDILDDEGVGSLTPAVKVPPSLLTTEAESHDLSGEAGELATYEIATSIMYRGFLLLDPCDAETVDKYLDNEERRNERGEASAPPSSALRGDCSTPGLRDRDSAQKPGNGVTPRAAEGIDAPATEHTRMDDDWQGGEHDEGMMWDDPHQEENNDGAVNDQGPREECSGAAAPAATVEDDYVDPWKPLNPHELGTLPIKPLKIGVLQRKVKPKRDRFAPIKIARHQGVCFPEFEKAWQDRERNERAQRRGEVSQYEMLRSSFFQTPDGGPSIGASQDFAHEEGLGGASEDSDVEDHDVWGGAHEAPDDNNVGGVELHTGPAFHPLEEDPIYPTDENVFRPHEGDLNFDGIIEDENMTLEELCQVHLDSMLKKLADKHEVRSGLVARVTSWKNKIEATLQEDESRPPFDIHEYGDHLLARLAAKKTQQDGEVIEPFSYLVKGQQKEQVARSFSALLQLVNNGNVQIDRGVVGNGSHCFTVENPFSIKLLSSQNRHEGMFQHMAQSKPAKVSNRRRASQPQTPVVLATALRTPVNVTSRVSPVSYTTTRSGLRVGTSSAIFRSPSSVKKSSRKRGQSVACRLSGVDVENRGTPGKGYTPVKLTPSRRLSKRKPLVDI